MKRLRYILTLALIAFSTAASAQKEDAEKLAYALQCISQYYVDSVDMGAIAEAALRAMAAQLDPHTNYITASDATASDEQLGGAFEGVGIEFSIIADTLTVQSTISGGPASKVGMRAGDKILEVDCQNVTGVSLTNEQVRKLLRGPRGTKVALKVMRRGVEELLEFDVIRDKIPMESVAAAYNPAPGIIYIKLSRFASTSTKEVFDAIVASGDYPDGVILDLRGNSGGYLGAALNIANFFLKKGELMLYYEGLNFPCEEFHANGNGAYMAGPLVVMVDENSASSSEIVAGALQDWDRAIIVGRRTFGKGLVQRPFKFKDDSELRLTIARYHTPTGRVIQSPYKMGHKDDYYDSFRSRYDKGESFSRDSISVSDSTLAYKTLKLGKTVYGGGGIMPDIFVPRDTSFLSPFYTKVVSKNIVTDFYNGYIDIHRDELRTAYPDFETFDSKFDPAPLYGEMVNYARKQGIEAAPEDVAKSGRELELILKALVARSLYGENEYYRVVNSNDDDYKMALQLIVTSVERIREL